MSVAICVRMYITATAFVMFDLLKTDFDICSEAFEASFEIFDTRKHLPQNWNIFLSQYLHAGPKLLKKHVKGGSEQFEQLIYQRMY